MGIDKGLNPSTGEYVAFRINHLGNAVYIRLATHLGSWWADPSIGSSLHELARSKDVSRISVLARQYAEQDLRPLPLDVRARSMAVDGLYHLLWIARRLTLEATVVQLNENTRGLRLLENQERRFIILPLKTTPKTGWTVGKQ